jgi:hypothetical protein
MKRRQEDEPPLLGAREKRTVATAHPSGHRRPIDSVMDHAVREFMTAVLRADPVYRHQLPETYEQNLHQKTIRDHFTRWVDLHGVEMIKWAVTKFFNEVYLYEQKESSYKFAPHSNLSNWMATPGSAAIRQEFWWRTEQQRFIDIWENRDDG